MKAYPGDIVKLRNGEGSQLNIRLTVEKVLGSGEVELKRQDFFSERPPETLRVDLSEIVSVWSPPPPCSD